jgi:putative ABC transport system permease protein
VTHEYFEINKNAEVEDGRPLLRTDTAAIVVGANIAHPRNEEEPILKVGDRIKIKVRVGDETKELTLRVVGIYGRTGGSFGVNLDDSIGIPLRTAQQLFEVGGEFDYIMAQADSLDVVEEVADRIEEKLGDSVTVISFESAQELVGQVLGTIQAVLGGIAGISLIVAGVGIINTMTVSVMERTREIGVLKAIGAKSRDVLFLFLSEAMVTGAIGGLIGAVFGFILSQVVGNIINLPPSISPYLGALVVGFAIVTSVVSGLYPAWRASNLNPVEALRSE